MQSQRTQHGWVLKIEPGEEIVGTLQAFASAHGIRAGLISGLGAVDEAELGFFVPGTREYVRKVFRGDHEIGSLTGNFSQLEGRSFPHCHVVLGGRDFTAHTGHLFRGVVSVTCEVWIVTDPGVMERVRRPELGFNPLELR